MCLTKEWVGGFQVDLYAKPCLIYYKRDLLWLIKHIYLEIDEASIIPLWLSIIISAIRLKHKVYMLYVSYGREKITLY